MKMRMIFAAAALALAACGPVSTSAPIESASSSGAATQAARDAITVLARTDVDDKTVRGLWKGADVLAQMSNLSVAAGFLKPGTPTAKTVQHWLRELKKWVNVADEAERAGNSAGFAEALAHAQRAYRMARGELAPGGG